jgi:hypothetical protein
VQTSEETYTQEGNISVTFGNNTYIAYQTSPYLTRNGVAVEDQPTGKISNIIIYKGKVYCFLGGGGVFIYDDSTGERVYITGDNIFDSEQAGFINNSYFNSNGGLSTDSNYKYTNNYFPAKASGTYSIQTDKTTDTNTSFIVAFYNENKEFIKRSIVITANRQTGILNGSFKVTEATRYIRISCGKNYSDIYVCENVPNFMREKFKGTTYYGAYFMTRYTYNMSGRIPRHWAYINCNGVSKKYEFVPLGTFIADRPNAPSVKEIDFSCNDQMQLFDASMPSDTDLGITYPTTISTLFTKMCNYLGVPYLVSTFTNSSATISKRPAQFDNATMRTVLQWIAEAAGKNAKFNRDGEVVFVWLNTTNQELTESDYSSFTPCWYKTQQVDKLYNRNSQGGEDGIYGSGNGGYLILDNPLMKGAT